MGRSIREGRYGVSLGLHIYQPKRGGDHELMRGISTDPLGADWNGIAIEQCYSKLAAGGGLQNFDLYGTLRTEIARRDPETSRLMHEAMQVNGIGDSFLHNILPHMDNEDKKTLIEAGKAQYIRDVGKSPTVFWGAESAYDMATLEILADNGYEAFICAPEQIIQVDGEASDNRPTHIMLSKGRSIMALPFDRPVSSALGWDTEGRKNADRFVETYIIPALDRNEARKARRGDNMPNVMIAYTDGETFGLHDKFGHLFVIYLGKEALEKRDIDPVS
ncbi:MAG: hypothetical protein KGL95_02265, partial [Patescibacteria group bacterium]|nr:hypothetical protein [Patescibacteria group bacterium]